MDFVSTSLVTLSQPSGFWVSILNTFKNGTGTYILAVILIALIVRGIFSVVDIFNKKMTMKNSEINAKMQPELEAIKKKYGYDQRLMQQKTSEVYKKYQFNMMGSCLPMLLMLVLNFVVFLTLWNSLQKVSNYNIAEKYENLKTLYVNVIALNDKTEIFDGLELTEGDYLKVELTTNDDGDNVLKLIFLSSEDEQIGVVDNLEYNESLTVNNSEVYELLEKYVLVSEEDEDATTDSDDTDDEDEDAVEIVYVDTGYNELIKAAAEEAVERYYIETQEGFLWIKNVYKSESPSSPLFTKKEIKNYMSKYYTTEEAEQEKEFDYEGEIFDCVVAGIDSKSLGVNGYYILPIIAMLVSVLSLWLSNRLMRKKGEKPQKQNFAMYIIMPVIFGIFTFMYTSLFAVYLIVGQFVNMILTPLTTFIVKKWNAHDLAKAKDKNVIEVDYRRK